MSPKHPNRQSAAIALGSHVPAPLDHLAEGLVDFGIVGEVDAIVVALAHVGTERGLPELGSADRLRWHP